MKIWDSLTSLLTGMGDIARDKVATTEFADRPLGLDEIEAAFRNSWMVRKGICIPGEDATRMWRRWEADTDQVELIENTERIFNVPSKVCDALTYARTYGGSLLIIGTDQDLSKPIELDRLGEGSLKWLHAVPSVGISCGPLITDIRSPWYGHAEYYTSATATGDLSLSARIHPSHVARMVGNELPNQVMSGQPWGDPVLKSVFDSAKHAGMAPNAVTQLLMEANVDIMKMPGLTANLQTREGTNKINEYASKMTTMRSVYRTMLLDKEMSWERMELKLTGAGDLISILIQLLCAGFDVPAVRFLGESAPGLNSTGEVDLHNYYDNVRSKQERKYTPALSVLDEVLIRSSIGSRDPAIWYDWRSLWQMTRKEESEVNKLNSESAKILVDSGLVPTPALAKSVQGQLVESGLYPGLETFILEAEEAGDLTTEDPSGDGFGRKAKGYVKDRALRTLYVRRDLKNSEEFFAWARSQGFTELVPDPHVTILYSKSSVDWQKMGEPMDGSELIIREGGPRSVEPLGDSGAIVLHFASSALSWRHEDMIRSGASHDYEEYQCHVTIAYGGNVDLSLVVPYRGKLVFGPEIFEETKG